MYYVTIQGVRHAVTVQEDGTKQYDPPLTTKDKTSPQCKEMLESQTPPGIRSDTSFHAGRNSLLSQLEGDENWARHLGRQAKKRGLTLTGGETYIGQLDDIEGGNPDAFLKPGEGYADLKKRCEKSGKGIDMPGLYVPATNTIKKKHALNPRVTRRFMQEYRKSGTAGNMTNSELKSYVEKKHGRPDSA